MVKIYMDDCRDCPRGFILARTTKECMKLLKKYNGQVSVLSLDHDMGEGDADGYGVTKHMVSDGLYADTIYLHTANPAGKENMYYCLMGAIRQGLLPSHIRIIRGPYITNDELGGR